MEMLQFTSNWKLLVSNRATWVTTVSDNKDTGNQTVTQNGSTPVVECIITWYNMWIQLPYLGPDWCLNITPHFSNSRRTRLVSPVENLYEEYRRKELNLYHIILQGTYNLGLPNYHPGKSKHEQANATMPGGSTHESWRIVTKAISRTNSTMCIRACQHIFLS